MSAIRTLLVDDERLARAEMRRLLQPHADVAIIAEAADADAARLALNEHAPDLVFMDIELPGGNGIELARQLDGPCQLVFCSAHDRFAVDAFHLSATDYLLKPVAPDRLAQTLDRVRLQRRQRVEQYLPLDHGLLLRFGESTRVVRLREIDSFDSVANHAAVHTPHGVAYVLSSIRRIEQRLDPNYFLRANRTTLLRLDGVVRFDESVGYGLTAHLRDGRTVELSRRAAQQLRTRLDLFR